LAPRPRLSGFSVVEINAIAISRGGIMVHTAGNLRPEVIQGFAVIFIAPS